jgi:hypothetical protein
VPERLIKFWSRCEVDGQHLVHPEDWGVLKLKGKKLISSIPGGFNDFACSPMFDDPRLHLQLIPQPYAGDLRKAKVVIVLLNPGLTFTDYWGEAHISGFRERLIKNLRQTFDDSCDFPFLWLNPDLCWHGGFVWWERKLRDVTTKIAERCFNGSYRDALWDLSKRIASAELFPYHSSTFGAHSILESLPSVKAMREFVRNGLLQRADGGLTKLIVTRQAEGWKLPTSHEHVVIYPKSQARGASLGPDSRGGKAILQTYGI